MTMKLRLPEDLHRSLKACAEREGRSMHALVVEAVDRYLANASVRVAVRAPGTQHAVEHADLLLEPGAGEGRTASRRPAPE